MADQGDKPYEQFIPTIPNQNIVSLYIELNYLLLELKDENIKKKYDDDKWNAYIKNYRIYDFYNNTLGIDANEYFEDIRSNADKREKLIELINHIIEHILKNFKIPEDLVGKTQEEMNELRGVYDLNILNVQKPEKTQGDKPMRNGGYLIKPKSKKKSKRKLKKKSKRKSKK